MIYLSGAVHHEVDHPSLGWMITPDTGYRVPDHGWWALDNGCFAHPHDFDLDRFLRFAERRLAEAGDRCLFVVAPDVPFDADGTVRRFEAWGQRIAQLGAPVAFVTQNGMGVEDVPWSDIAATFIGGDDRWKTCEETLALAVAARHRGAWVHMGRVNTWGRLHAAAAMGVDSVDGNFLKWFDAKWPTLRRWLDGLRGQRRLALP